MYRFRFRFLKVLLIVGALVGFGSAIRHYAWHHGFCRSCYGQRFDGWREHDYEHERDRDFGSDAYERGYRQGLHDRQQSTAPREPVAPPAANQ